VDFHVLFENENLSEAFVALVALEGFLTRMNRLVIFQRVLAG
jgi:hypothetical protein